jgi:AraC family transcriptional regulator, transcriptional activator of the genes for pyochelin and ferripyochelin receptors
MNMSSAQKRDIHKRGDQEVKTYSAPSFEDFKRLPESEDPHVFNISMPEVKGHFRMLKKGSITLTDGCIQLSDAVACGHSGMRHFNELPLVEMNFVQEGNIVQKNSYLPDELHFAKGYHNIMYNQGEWEHNRFVGGGVHNTFTIHMFADRFAGLFSAHSAELDNLAEKVLAGKPFLIEQPARIYTPYMQTVINALWNCPLRGGLKSLYLETRITELMLLQWGLFTLAPKSFSVLKNKADMEKMHLAKELLLKDIYNPPSLAELAQLCGTNEFKLKKGFKEVFNDTVFGYFNTIRLEQAMQLIRDTGKTMAEIAHETGYAHQQHFTRAFKKQFGVTPGSLRK